MSRLDEIKNEYAVNHGFYDWEDMWFDKVNFKQADERYDEISKLYAIDMVKKSLEKAGEKATSNFDVDYQSGEELYSGVDKNSITDPSNIVLL